MCSIEWILLQHCSGLVHYSFLDYLCIYHVVKKGHPYFMHKLPLDAECL